MKGGENPLQQAIALCRDEMAQVDRCIVEQLRSEIAMIPAVGRYIVGSGGKRLRPLICLLAARLFGYRGREHIPPAVVIEFIHTASLLHDDVVDAARERRGTPSANGVWGNQASVLVGDYLFSRAFQMLVQAGDMTVLSLMSDTTNALAEGEVLQLSRTFHIEMCEAECLEVIERKTAVLFRAAAGVGALVAGRDTATVTRMAEYGMALGVAFQLMDDALDYTAERARAGKPVGHDLEEGKITLPLIHAMARDPELRARVEAIAENDGYRDEEERDWVRRRVLHHGGDVVCMERAADYARRAARAVEAVDGDPTVTGLLQRLAGFAARRDH
ncbi:MAG: octaprenyl-diphosphate synthase [Zetaproteobacteria bacterium]|nr:MAG: octaprenyl-diphosphate synthase [Zetaproteobacteria bacterium]